MHPSPDGSHGLIHAGDSSAILSYLALPAKDNAEKLAAMAGIVDVLQILKSSGQVSVPSPYSLEINFVLPDDHGVHACCSICSSVS